jgi:hypothetical protein
LVPLCRLVHLIPLGPIGLLGLLTRDHARPITIVCVAPVPPRIGPRRVGPMTAVVLISSGVAVRLFCGVAIRLFSRFAV